LKYIDKLEVLPDYEPNNALIVGTALHTGIEKDVKTAIDWYYSQYPIITDLHIEEAIKLEAIIPKCKAVLPSGIYEEKIENENFIGFMDLLVPVENGIYDLYDFKYSNNVKNYLESGQLHEYKYFFEKTTGNKIRKMYFLFAPKVAIRLKKTETQEQFRMRLKAELKDKEPQLVEIPFNSDKVSCFIADVAELEQATTFEKSPSRLCDWCVYKNFCENGDETMILPKNERRQNNAAQFKKLWLYGLPFSGKTYLANKFDDVLMLNTDGNIKYVDAPCIPIKDEVSVDGRITKRTFAWDIFRDTILELEKGSDFKTIVVDLLEDTYEHCRLWCYDHLGIEHESDNSFKAWDFVRTEFLSVIKKLMNLDYNIILISHEDTSKDITKKSGDKITAIKPNLNEKVALKIAGMVDIVGRVINDNGERTISFKSNEVIFGGGRLNLNKLDIPCEYNELIKIYKDVAEPVKTVEQPKVEEPKVETATQKPVEVETATAEPQRRRTVEQPTEATEERQPRRRRQREEQIDIF
jgi:phage nucleotide-binding protein